MKTFNQYNFFKHSYCDFVVQDDSHLKLEETHFKSKAGSQYYYTDEGVYRYSNHWGRVANCRWKLSSTTKLKSQNYYVGYAKWTDFYDLNETEKQFYIAVDFQNKTVDFIHKKDSHPVHLFFRAEAQKRVIQIRRLLAEDKWAAYLEGSIEKLRENIITAYINSNKSIQEIKRDFLT